MKMLGVLLIGVTLATAAPVVAAPQQRHGDAEAARDARMRGQILPLREIERRIVPTMRGAQYIGFDFDSGTAVYTLKFLRDGHVIWVSVDGRSGAVIGRAGN